MSQFGKAAYPARSWDDPVSVGLFVVHVFLLICLCVNTIFFVTYKQRSLKTKIMFGAFHVFLIITLSAYLFTTYWKSTGTAAYKLTTSIAGVGISGFAPMDAVIQLEIFKSFIAMADRKWITLWRIKCLQVSVGIVYLLPLLSMIITAASSTVGAFGSSIY
jgi:hypothetical protein